MQCAMSDFFRFAKFVSGVLLNLEMCAEISVLACSLSLTGISHYEIAFVKLLYVI